MRTIDVHEIPQDMKLLSVADMAMYLNVFHRQVVELTLETYTEFTDFDIIAEIIDELNLDIICVVEPIPQGKLIYGYINNEDKVKV